MCGRASCLATSFLATSRVAFSTSLSLPYVLPPRPLPFTLFTRTPLALFRGPLHSSSQSLPDGRACWRLYYAAALNKHLYYILCSIPFSYLPLPLPTLSFHSLPVPTIPFRSVPFRTLFSYSSSCVFFCHSPRKWPSLLVKLLPLCRCRCCCRCCCCGCCCRWSLVAQKLNLKLK